MKTYIVKYTADNGAKRVFHEGHNKEEAFREADKLVENNLRIDVYETVRTETFLQGWKVKKGKAWRKIGWINKKF